MKRFILMVAAAALLAIPAAEAQKVNKEATLSKLEKSDADIANPKKNAKAATWINRGKVYYDAAAEPTANLFAPMETTLMKLSVGDPASTEEVTINGAPAIAWNYPYFIAYEKGGKIVAWKQLQEIKEGALDTAIEAYNKAYELDPKLASKIKEGLEQIVNYASILGNVSIETGEYLTGADAYLTAYKAQQCPAFGEADPAFLYYAGYLRTVDGSAHPSSFGQGAEYLKKAIDLGVSKINVNTECQLAFADATRKYIEAGKDLEGKGFDPRKLLAPGAEAIKATVKEKMELFGSVGKAE